MDKEYLWQWEKSGKATNIKNVEFDAYLSGEENKISLERTLILDINVKEKGVLNDGKIKIENANFGILKDKISNTYIKNINLETNEIELNSIIYQNNVKIEIPIQFKRQEEFEEDYFNRMVVINVEGTYKDEVEGKVEARRTLEVNWTEDVEVTLSQDIKKLVKIENVGTILQQEIVTNVLENKLPRENEMLLIEVPDIQGKQPKDLYVIKNGIRLVGENIDYEKETKVLEIKDEKSLIWGKSENTYKVVYVYDNIEEIAGEIKLNTLANTKLYTKEAIQKQENKNLPIEEKGNIVSIKKSASQEIFKGYLYANVEQETEILEESKIEITNKEAVDKIQLTKVSEAFTNGTENFDVSNSVTYKTTKVEKEEFERILGQDGKITITDETGAVIGEINKDTLEITYEAETKNIIMEMTKPIEEGELTITNIRAIKGKQPYSKEQLKTFTKMITTTKVISNGKEEVAEAEILLNDTKTEANIEINNSNLSTLQNNENVQLLVTLKSDSSEYDLYKNPVVSVILPAELSVIVKNITQLNAQDQLGIVNSSLTENENGEKVIQMQLQGEQTTFENAINEGIQIAITMDIETDKTTPTKNSEIKMTYTNENRPEEVGEKKVPIRLNSKYGVLTVNKLYDYNESEETIENVEDKVKEANLEANAEAKVAKQEIAIVNNYENEITNVTVVGKIPNKGQEEVNGETLKATFEMNLNDAVRTGEGSISHVYYSENPNEEKESNNWTKEPEDFNKVRAFKLELEESTIKPQEVLKISYPLTIPEGLEYEQSAYTKVDVDYNYSGNEIKSQNAILLTTGDGAQRATNDTIGQLAIETVAESGTELLKEGQEVKEGQAILYKVTLTNNSTQVISGVDLEATHTNVIYYDEIKRPWDRYEEPEDEGTMLTMIDENEELTSKAFHIEELQPGETKILTYQVSVKENSKNSLVEGKIKVSANEIEEDEIQTMSFAIKEGKLKLKILNEHEEEIILYAREALPIKMDIKNITNETLKDVIVELPLSEDWEFREDYMGIEQEEKCEYVRCEDGIVTYKIKEISPQEVITIRTKLIAKSMPTNMLQKNITLLYRVYNKEETYISNTINKVIHQLESEISVNHTSNIVGELVKNGENIIYTTKIKNNGKVKQYLSIEEAITNNANIDEAHIKKNNEIIRNIGIYYNRISTSYELEPGEEIQLIAKVTVNASLLNTNKIVNTLEIKGAYTDEKAEIIHKIEGKEEETSYYSIKGTAWLDENKNGAKENSEKRLSNINVMLIDEKTGDFVIDDKGEKVKSVTNNEGNYEFSNIKQGEYLVIFEYDVAKFIVTEYQKTGVSENLNSDVISKKVKIGNQEKQVAITKSLSLTVEDLENIDAGFIEAEKFDLKLDKYISKVIVQNSQGTRVIEYQNGKLEKIELDAKTITNTNIIIEYKIKVTNEGETPGYASELVDYIPADLKFNSETNKDWYQGTDRNLHTKQLANQIINPGETKEVNLVLIKTMTPNNTGGIINTAEIEKDNNDLSIQDIDSIPGNKADNEDDISTAELIISIRTGSIAIAIGIIITILITISLSIYFINKKVVKKDIEV